MIEWLAWGSIGVLSVVGDLRYFYVFVIKL
jgi:hypothetical protein